MEAKENYHEDKNIDQAIKACESHINRHSLLSKLTIYGALVILILISLFVIYYAQMEGRILDQKRLDYIQKKNEIQKVIEDTIAEQRRTENYISENEDYLISLKNRLSSLKSENKKEISEIKANIASTEEKKKYDESQLEQIKKYLNEQYENKSAVQSEMDSGNVTSTLIPDKMLYGVGILFILILSLSTSIYRFHLKEMTKNEQYRIGFLRIIIAGNNIEREGFRTEVRKSLVESAFDFQPDTYSLLKGRKKVESPVPGHPGYDLATVILNNILDQINIIVEKKSK